MLEMIARCHFPLKSLKRSLHIGRLQTSVFVHKQETVHVVSSAALFLDNLHTQVLDLIRKILLGLICVSGLVVRLVYGLPFCSMLLITHNRDNNTTYAVCCGIAPEHADRLLASLRESQSYAFSPLHVAFLLSDLALEDLERFSLGIYCDFGSVRTAMGTNLYSLAEDHFPRAPQLSDMPRRLTALANALACNCSSLSVVSDIVDTMALYFQGFSERSECDTAYRIEFLDRLTLMRQIIRNSLRRNGYVEESVQAQVQMVSSCR